METDVRGLEHHALNIRRRIVRLTGTKGVGHTGGSLSMADMMAALYFHAMNHDPADPAKADRDRFILSKGHATPGYYSTLCEAGYFAEEELMAEYDELSGRFQGHPDMHKTPGVDMSSGSLGQGLSVGIGIALGLARKNITANTFVMMGDGEMQEGQVWEALMYAGNHRVPRLVALVDRNSLQLTAATSEVLGMANLPARLDAFGWKVLTCDGNDMAALVTTLDAALDHAPGGPVVIVADTVKGKGVSFMENRVAWHSKAPNAQEMAAALKELEDGHER